MRISLVSLAYLIAQCTVMDYLKSIQNILCGGSKFVLIAIMHVTHVNTENLTYTQHMFFISGLYNFHCFMCGGIKPPVYMTRFPYFRICTVSWKVGMTQHHPHTKKTQSIWAANVQTILCRVQIFVSLTHVLNQSILRT